MKVAKYNALEVSNYVLWYYENILQKPMQNLKLNKILYYLQGVYLAKYEYPLFGDNMECWKYGLVVPKVQSYYSCYGSCDISNNKKPKDFLGKISNDELNIINMICNNVKDISGHKLVNYIKLDNCCKQYENNNLFLEALKNDFKLKLDK